MLDELVAEADGVPGADAMALTPTEISAQLRERLEGRPTRANFRTGHLTVCTLEPMRSVPHRIVCLLGLDDDAFPRKAPRDGDDLLLDDPWIGERDPRSEDRQLLLDALMAAGERLLITYTGRDERTNTRRPPAVPIGELLDTIEQTARFDDGTSAGERLVDHPPTAAVRRAQLHPRRARAPNGRGALTPRRSAARGRWSCRPPRRRRSWPTRCRPAAARWSSSTI